MSKKEYHNMEGTITDNKKRISAADMCELVQVSEEQRAEQAYKFVLDTIAHFASQGLKEHLFEDAWDTWMQNNGHKVLNKSCISRLQEKYPEQFKRLENLGYKVTCELALSVTEKKAVSNKAIKRSAWFLWLIATEVEVITYEEKSATLCKYKVSWCCDKPTD